MSSVALRAATGALVLVLSSPAFSALSLTRTDTSTTNTNIVNGTLDANEYGPGNSYVYSNGGGAGFGGTVGNGTIYMNADAIDLYIGFQPGDSLNDLAFLLLDTRSGGVLDANMNDLADGGRRASSSPAVFGPADYDPGFLPDFALVFGNFGAVLFELTPGTDPFHLNFVSFDGSTPSFREFVIPLATLGLSTTNNIVDFFMGYTSETGFQSNESLPAAPLNGSNNPGFSAVGNYDNFNRFELVPEPASLALLALGGLAFIRRRR